MQAQNTHRYLHAHKDTNRHGRWLQDQTKVGSVSLFNLSVKSLHGTECSCYCSSTPCLLPPSPPPHPPPARLINAALRCSEKMMSPKLVLSLCFLIKENSKTPSVTFTTHTLYQQVKKKLGLHLKKEKYKSDHFLIDFLFPAR